MAITLLTLFRIALLAAVVGVWWEVWTIDKDLEAQTGLMVVQGQQQPAQGTSE